MTSISDADASGAGRYDILFEPVRIGPLTLVSVRGIGDAWAPGTIAAAVWSGRRFAEEFDAELPSSDVVPFRREVTGLATLPLIRS